MYFKIWLGLFAGKLTFSSIKQRCFTHTGFQRIFGALETEKGPDIILLISYLATISAVLGCLFPELPGT